MDEEDVKKRNENLAPESGPASEGQGLPPEQTPVADLDKAAESVTADETPKETGSAIEATPAETNDGKTKTIDLLKKHDINVDAADEGKIWDTIFSLLSTLFSTQDWLVESIDEFPELGDMLSGIHKGMTPSEAIARYYDMETLTPPEGAPDYEKYQGAMAERKKEVEAKKARKKQLEENQQVSVENVKKFMDAKGWDKNKALEFLGKIEGLQADLFDGKLSDNHLAVLEKGFGYDDMVAEKDKEKELAIEDARVAGKNEGIKERRAKKETSDGVPKLTNSASVPDTTKKPKDQFTTSLEQLANKKKIL
jgi:hypothetical protein